MKKTLMVSIIFLFLLTSCIQQDVVKNQPKELLYVWLHDVGFEDPNFLAVINADSESENYGELVDTIPVLKQLHGHLHQYFCQAQPIIRERFS